MDRRTNTDTFTPPSLKDALYGKEKTLYTLLAVLAGIFWLAITLSTLGIALLYVLMFYIIFLFSHSAFISYLKGTAVEIDAQQFPDLHQRILEGCRRLEMPVPPRAYLLAADGMLNALATRFLRRHYIVLFSSIVDALQDDPEAINFYIGHELGHIRRNHLGKAPFLAPVAWLPLIGPAYSRACEYTCDLHGLRCCESLESATNAIGVLAAGSEQWKRLNAINYVRQTQETGEFWMSFHELTGDYPWLTKRMAAVRARAQGQIWQAPGRHPLAYLFALLTPRTFGAAGGIIIFVAIIGMLAAVAIPEYQKYMEIAGINYDPNSGSSLETDPFAVGNPGDAERSQWEIAAQVTSLQPVETAVLAYVNARQDWPESLDQLTLENASFNDFPGLTLHNEGILAFTGSDALGDYQENEIYLIPQLDAETGQYTWSCHSPDIPDSHLPEDCQG